jgi:hypothetical protein
MAKSPAVSKLIFKKSIYLFASIMNNFPTGLHMSRNKDFVSYINENRKEVDNLRYCYIIIPLKKLLTTKFNVFKLLSPY